MIRAANAAFVWRRAICHRRRVAQRSLPVHIGSHFLPAIDLLASAMRRRAIRFTGPRTIR